MKKLIYLVLALVLIPAGIYAAGLGLSTWDALTGTVASDDLMAITNVDVLTGSTDGTSEKITVGELQDFFEGATNTWTGTNTFSGTVNLPAAIDLPAESVDSDDYVDGSIDAEHIASYTLSPIILAEPDQLQPIADAWPLYQFLGETYPSGVTITSIHVKTSATNTDVLNFEEWAQTGTSATATVEEITLSGTYTEDDGTLADADIAADGWLYVDLPASPTDIGWIAITISFTSQ